MGKAVAEKVAQTLSYPLISREVVLDASSHFNVPEIKLEKAIHDAPSILERYRHNKQSYIAYFRSALVERVIGGNVVYHGMAGHLLLKGIQPVLKIRINADIKRRVSIVMERDKIPAPDARALILEDDKQRRKWTQSLYGQDPWDSSLYDLTISIDKLSIENAVEFICQAASTKEFQITEKNKLKMQDMSVACRVKAALVDEYPNIGVVSEYGNVLIYMKGKDSVTGKLNRKLKDIQESITGIHRLEIHAGADPPTDAV